MREGWINKKLGDVCQVVTGSTPKTNISEYWDGNYPWVTPAELKGDVYISDTARHITEKAIAHTNLTLLPIGTVLLSSRAPIGKVAITTIEMYCNQGFKNLICSDAINNKYLYLWLSGKTEYLNSLGRGATFKEISKTIVENVIIPLPPLSTQLSIVSELDKINELIRLKKEQLKDYDNLAQSIFYEMFGDPVVNEKGWEVKRITDLCIEISAGGDASKHEIKKTKDEIFSVPVYSNGIDEDGLYGYSNHATIIQPAITLAARGTIGAAFIRTEPYIPIIRLVSVIPDLSKISLTYLFYILKQTEWDRTGGTIPQLPVPKVKQLTLPHPPLPLQQAFAQRIELIEQQKAEIQSTIADLETLLASRMQYWFD